MQAIWQKLVRGMQNYCKENGFTDVTLGLSGGLDSAVTAVLAADALGGEHVHALMMSTKHTSQLSLDIARKIAELNKLNYKEVSIDSFIEKDKDFLTSLFNEQPKNIVLENLQARERGKILMALSNQHNYLVLACGNKSEIAMGYCTLYGDTCGGLAPIAELYKTQIFELAAWRNQQGEVLPSAVISRAPSAELSEGQKDEDTLPPYKVLDKILELYLDKHQSAAAIIADGFDAVTVDWVIRRYHAQGFKRLQLPPVIRL